MGYPVIRDLAATEWKELTREICMVLFSEWNMRHFYEAPSCPGYIPHHINGSTFCIVLHFKFFFKWQLFKSEEIHSLFSCSSTRINILLISFIFNQGRQVPHPYPHPPVCPTVQSPGQTYKVSHSSSLIGVSFLWNTGQEGAINYKDNRDVWIKSPTAEVRIKH